MRLSDLISQIKTQPWAQGNRIIRGAGGFLIRRLLLAGVLTWGTKSYAFWTFLMLVLAVVRPRSIVELGGGRSTSYLAEYAMKERVPYACIEQSSSYARKLRRGLRNSFLDPRFVHRVPLGLDGWYDTTRLGRVITFAPGLLFIDGPVGLDEGLGRGTRTTASSRQWLAAAARGATVIIVDDIHREANLDLFRELTGPPPERTAVYLNYPAEEGPNVVGLAVPTPLAGKLRHLAAEAGVVTFTSFEAAVA